MEDIQVIIKFLENAKNIEMSIYTQNRIISNLSKKINNLNTKKSDFSKPTKPSYKHSNSTIIATFFQWFLTFAIIPSLIIISWFIYLALSPALTSMDKIILYITIGVLISLGGAIFKTSALIKENNNFLKIEMANYENNLVDYHKSKDNEDKRVTNTIRQKDYLSLQVSELNKTLKNTKETLKDFYSSSNLVYPKYLNLLAVTQILEYLQSGRCDTLTGPHGAYNLYESELRMNTIINNLDQVIYHLEEIKESQYMIYMELCKGNEIAEKLLYEVSNSNAYLKDIAINSAVSSYNAQITAYNSSICAFNTSFS